MTCYGDRPKTCADTHERCEAVTGAIASGEWQEWRKTPHRCVRKSEQMRGLHFVCWQHAQQDTVRYCDGLSDSYSFTFGGCGRKAARERHARMVAAGIVT